VIVLKKLPDHGAILLLERSSTVNAVITSISLAGAWDRYSSTAGRIASASQ
jgi:hypothetical protein